MAWHLASACKSLSTHCMWLCCLGCSAFEGFPLFWHGLLWSSPFLLCGLLARLSVQLYSSLSLGSFVALGFQCVYGMALFGVGLRPGNTIGFNEGLFLSCVFASCSSCSLALVVMAAAEWGKKRGGAATQLLTPLQNVNSHGKATHTCSRCGPGLNATRQRGDACIPPLQQDCAH